MTRSLIRGGLGGRVRRCSIVWWGVGAMMSPRLLASMYEGICEETLYPFISFQSIVADIIIFVIDLCWWCASGA